MATRLLTDLFKSKTSDLEIPETKNEIIKENAKTEAITGKIDVGNIQKVDTEQPLNVQLLEIEKQKVVKLERDLLDEKQNILQLQKALQDEKKYVLQLDIALKDEKQNILQLQKALQDEKQKVAKLETALKDEKQNVANQEKALQDEKQNVTKLNQTIQVQTRQIAALTEKVNRLIETSNGTSEVEKVVLGSNELFMPNLIGLTETVCSQVLLSCGLKIDPIYQYSANAKGGAVQQSVLPNTMVNKGEVITIVFAKKI